MPARNLSVRLLVVERRPVFAGHHELVRLLRPEWVYFPVRVVLQ